MAKRGEAAWQIDKTVLDCNRYMLDNTLANDVTFRVHSPGGGSEDIPAHSYVLISRSPVFEALFCGDFAQPAHNGEAIEICDIEPEAFRQLLRYLYCEEVSLTPDNVLPVLYAAKKYLLLSLARQCMNFLEQKISVETVCTILNHSILYEERELTEKCLAYVAPRMKQILKSECFLGLSPMALSRLLSYDLLYVDCEVDLLETCLKWSTGRTTKQNTDVTDPELRALLSDNLRKIRFASMSPNEFAKAVGKTEILTHQEKSYFYYYLLTNEGKENLLELGFDLSYRVQRCQRYPCLGKTAGWWTCNGPGDAISFLVDKPITLVGAAVYGGREPSTHNVTLELWKNPDVQLSKSEHKVESDGTASPIPIYFNGPGIELSIKEAYTILAIMKGPIAYYGQGGTENIISKGVTFQFCRSEKSGNGTNIKSGQIPELLFLPPAP